MGDSNLHIYLIVLGVVTLVILALYGVFHRRPVQRRYGKYRPPEDVKEKETEDKVPSFFGLRDQMQSPQSGDAFVHKSEEEPGQWQNRPLVYIFQHVALREAAFENHPELITELTAPPRSQLSLLHFRSRAQLYCENAGLVPEEDLLDDAAADARLILFEAVRVTPVRKSGYTAHVVTMPLPEYSPEAYFVAIVLKDDEPHEYREASPSTRYFTLERTAGTNRPLFCEWLRNGTRKIYGEISLPNMETFTNAVFQQTWRPMP